MQKLSHITEQQWNEVNPINRQLLDEFIELNMELSEKTRRAYYSNLRIWFVWVKDYAENKQQTAIKPLDYKKFQNWLTQREASSADINAKRAAVSSLNNYIITYHSDEHPFFRNFVNKSIKRPQKKFVHNKQPLTKAEFTHLIEVLEEQGLWQEVAYLKFTLCTGCRREESRQLLKSVVDAQPIEKRRITKLPDGNIQEEVFYVYQTHPIRCKGTGQLGKVRKLTFDQETMEALKKWLEVRGEDKCPHMFVSETEGKVKQVPEGKFNIWAKKIFEPIIGRRFHPHLLRESRATQAVVEEGKDINSVRALLGHESAETTAIYVIREDEENIDDLF